MADEASDSGLTTLETLSARATASLAELWERQQLPGLYLVATPIGHLGDISLRALVVLAKASLVACEDTRHSGKLLAHYGIKAKLTPYHEHNAAAAKPKLLARIREGGSVALISDAGTPLISDPGYKLVRDAIEEGIAVTAIPGPSAGIAALSASGLPTDSFFFGGFLPPKTAPRQARLQELSDIQATLIFYESANRLSASLADMAVELGPREAVVARELTKLHEQFVRGRLTAIVEGFDELVVPRGEFVVLVAPPPANAMVATDADITAMLREVLTRLSLRDAAREVAEILGVKRSHVYQLGLRIAEEDR